FSPPDGDHAWVPTAPGQRPLVPNWSTMRPLALSSSDACQPPPPIPFSTHRDSEFFRQAKEVYDTTMNLSDEEIEIALFWSDDPGATGTPAGHWVSIANSIVSDLGLSLDRTVEMYALLGIAGADAFISCWDEKYRSYLVRPVTYIQEHIDSSWDTLLVTPSFPEYTSGHSNISGASAMVLTSLFGALPFDDDLHAGRGLPSRSFASFTEAAQEAAISRLYGGIHYPMGIELGVKQGQCVGRNVMNKVRTRQLR
ncbi:MAG: vanadium-dependent haloperoxidase, partial [Bradymonadaceae bacterium]